MTFRRRLTLSLAVVVILPLMVVFVGVRFELGRRLESQYRDRMQASVRMVENNLAAEVEGLERRLIGLKNVMRSDNDLRRAVAGDQRYARYLRDYAAKIMRVSGLGMLQIEREDGMILSSGHFRNQFGVRDERTRVMDGGWVVTDVQTAEGRFTALVVRDSVTIGGRTLQLIGGIELDEAFFTNLNGSDETAVSLHYPGGVTGPGVNSEDPAYLQSRIPVRFVTETGSRDAAAIVVAQSTRGLRDVRALIDQWILLVGAGVILGSLIAALWLSRQLSGPVRALAAGARSLDLDRLDVSFPPAGPDEFELLRTTLNDLAFRLRKSTASLRQVERRATTGELARQVNHDIKNGLAPLRNVLDHLEETARAEPGELERVFADRLGTLRASVEYLEKLAANYAGLQPRTMVSSCDVNELIGEILSRHSLEDGVRLVSRIDPDVPLVRTDVTMLRRIVENLLDNARHAVTGRPDGEVVVSTSVADDSMYVRISIADNGPGMTERELNAAFEDFYTTKEGGNGLGLLIVRRLVLDAGGRLKVQSEPGRGSVFDVELPIGPD